MTMTMTTPSFYSPTPTLADREGLLTSLHDHVLARNGADFAAREARMASEFDRVDGSASFRIDADRFNRNYGGFREKDIPLEEVALLAFVKINAGEAYGVEVTSRSRAHLLERPETRYRVEKAIGQEETFHTRLLLGATLHFEALSVGSAWKPTWPLRFLIGGLARFPAWLFHPVLLGSEISGVHSFTWLLHRVGTMFPNDPLVRESMERRLIDILVDEVGHIAYNRILLGTRGRSTAKRVASMVTAGHRVMNPELLALGLDNEAMKTVTSFDYDQLPDEVKRRAFFV